MGGLLVVTPPGPEADALCALLKDRGFVVTQAANGATAVTLAERRAPDAILMDPSLSAMDRWHAVKRLGTEPATARVPVLALPDDATSPAGFQRLLGKIERTLGGLPPPAARLGSTPPQVRAVSPTEVRPSVPPPLRVEARQSAQPDVPATPTFPPAREVQPEGAHLLVVDDNALNRDMLCRRLTRRGFRVTAAEDGASAIKVVEQGGIDLLLLDWMMPGMSGIEVLHALRVKHSASELPIVMATAKTESDDIVEALKAGANDYVTKPLNFDIVFARVQTQLSAMRAHRELKASEGRFRALLENTGDMIVQYDIEGRVQYVSPASRTLLGFEPEALKARSFYDWIHPIDRRALLEQQRERVALPPAFTFIARMQRQDGAYSWVETSCRLLRDGEHTRVQAACRDVSEHMEHVSGEEPPLPLGGDIMAHPGWRGASTSPAPERRASPEPPSPPRGVVAWVDGSELAAMHGDADAIAEAVAERVRAALASQGGVSRER